jgi:protein-S-isoprenylcysteine O-methyltransferase Ste14
VNANPVHIFLVKKRTTFTWLIPVALFAASWVWGHRNVMIYAVGVILSLAGELVRVWAAGTIHKDDTIADAGPYALVRNPLYFGSFLIAIGVAFMSGIGPIGWGVIIVLFLVFHLAAIFYEERFLKEKFGAPYEQYLNRVPRLIPVPGRSKLNLASVGFSWQQVKFNREPSTATITVLTAVVYGVLQLLGK